MELKSWSFVGKIYQTFVVIVTFLLLVEQHYIITIVFSSNPVNIFWSLIAGFLAVLSIGMGLVFLSNICRYKLSPLFIMAIFAGLSHALMLGVIIPKLDLIHLSPRIASEIEQVITLSRNYCLSRLS